MFEFCICLCGVAACTFHRERFLHRKRHTFCVKSSQSLVRDGEEGFGRSLEAVSDKQDQLPSSPGVSTLFTGRRAQAAPKTRTGRAKSLLIPPIGRIAIETLGGSDDGLTLTAEEQKDPDLGDDDSDQEMVD